MEPPSFPLLVPIHHEVSRSPLPCILCSATALEHQDKRAKLKKNLKPWVKVKFSLQVGLLGCFGHTVQRQSGNNRIAPDYPVCFPDKPYAVRTAKVLCEVYDQTLAPGMFLTLPIGLRQTECIWSGRNHFVLTKTHTLFPGVCLLLLLLRIPFCQQIWPSSQQFHFVQSSFSSCPFSLWLFCEQPRLCTVNWVLKQNERSPLILPVLLQPGPMMH